MTIGNIKNLAVASAIALAMPFAIGSPAAAATVDSTTLLVSGSLTAPIGSLNGARVDIAAWPSSTALARVGSEEGFTPPTIAQVKPTTDGKYSIYLDPDTVGPDFLEKDGSVSLILTLTAGATSTRWRMTARPQRSSDGTLAGWATDSGIADEASASPASISAAIGSDTATLTDEMDPDAADAVSAPVLAAEQAPTVSAATSLKTIQTSSSSVAAEAVAPLARSCSWKPGMKHYDIKEYFGVARGWSGAKVTVTQTTGSKHTLGIGSKIGGQGWAKGGSATLTMNNESTADSERVVENLFNQKLVNRVTYQDWVYSSPDRTCVVMTDRIPLRESSLLEDDDLTKVNSVHFANSRPNCTRYRTGTVSKTRGKNSTVAGGVDIGPINVSAQAGWTASTKLSWKFTADSWFCGSTRNGPLVSPQAEAHPYRINSGPDGAAD